jgi:hypothetical protein
MGDSLEAALKTAVNLTNVMSALAHKSSQSKEAFQGPVTELKKCSTDVLDKGQANDIWRSSCSIAEMVVKACDALTDAEFQQLATLFTQEQRAAPLAPAGTTQTCEHCYRKYTEESIYKLSCSHLMCVNAIQRYH